MPSPNVSEWFATFLSKRIKHELHDIKTQLDALELQVQSMSGLQGQAQGPIVVEQIRIDKVIVERVEYQNNFGALGIKDLSGQMNIGVNYHMSKGSTIEQAKSNGLDELSSAVRQAKTMQQSVNNQQSESCQEKGAGDGPRVNIKSKPANNES